MDNQGRIWKAPNSSLAYNLICDGDTAECMKWIGYAQGILAGLLQKQSGSTSLLSTPDGSVEVRVDTRPNKIRITTAGGLLVTFEDVNSDPGSYSGNFLTDAPNQYHLKRFLYSTPTKSTDVGTPGAEFFAGARFWYSGKHNTAVSWRSTGGLVVYCGGKYSSFYQNNGHGGFTGITASDILSACLIPMPQEVLNKYLPTIPGLKLFDKLLILLFSQSSRIEIFGIKANPGSSLLTNIAIADLNITPPPSVVFQYTVGTYLLSDFDQTGYKIALVYRSAAANCSVNIYTFSSDFTSYTTTTPYNVTTDKGADTGMIISGNGSVSTSLVGGQGDIIAIRAEGDGFSAVRSSYVAISGLTTLSTSAYPGDLPLGGTISSDSSSYSYSYTIKYDVITLTDSGFSLAFNIPDHSTYSNTQSGSGSNHDNVYYGLYSSSISLDQTDSTVSFIFFSALNKCAVYSVSTGHLTISWSYSAGRTGPDGLGNYIVWKSQVTNASSDDGSAVNLYSVKANSAVIAVLPVTNTSSSVTSPDGSYVYYRDATFGYSGGYGTYSMQRNIYPIYSDFTAYTDNLLIFEITDYTKTALIDLKKSTYTVLPYYAAVDSSNVQYPISVTQRNY